MWTRKTKERLICRAQRSLTDQLDRVTKSVWMEERRRGKREEERERGMKRVKREGKATEGRREKIAGEERGWKDGGRKKSTDIDDW